MDRGGVMMGVKNAKFGKKRRFGNLVVVYGKGKEAEGWERRGDEGGNTLEGGRMGGWKGWSCHGH